MEKVFKGMPVLYNEGTGKGLVPAIVVGLFARTEEQIEKDLHPDLALAVLVTGYHSASYPVNRASYERPTLQKKLEADNPDVYVSAKNTYCLVTEDFNEASSEYYEDSTFFDIPRERRRTKSEQKSASGEQTSAKNEHKDSKESAVPAKSDEKDASSEEKKSK